jgi:hypothetical protein
MMPAGVVLLSTPSALLHIRRHFGFFISTAFAMYLDIYCIKKNVSRKVLKFGTERIVCVMRKKMPWLGN